MAEKKEKQYVSDNAQLMAEWDWEKNNKLDPTTLMLGSGKKVWWKCANGHEWEANPKNRSYGTSCPYCTNRKILKGYNDLQTINPRLAKEWNHEKNASLKPEYFTTNSGKKVWWKCENGHEWEATIDSRNRGNKCPYCSGHKVLYGYNDLQTVNPNLADEWNYEKNIQIKPQDFTASSGKKVWWKCKMGHEWQSIIASRNKGIGCPVCNSEKNTSFPEFVILYYLSQYGLDVIHSYKEQGYELDIYIPSKKIAIEYDGYFWHQNKINKDLEKNKKCKKDNIKLYRIREGLPALNDTSLDYIIQRDQKDFEIILKTILCEIIGMDITIDVDIKRDELLIENQREHIQKETSLLCIFPKVSAEWNYIKNGNLRPEYFTGNSHKKVWWKCSEGHEWQAAIYHRSKGQKCPYCSGEKVLPGYNDLKTINPSLANEWNYEKNIKIKPEDFTANSGIKVWWKCSKNHEWQSTIDNRNKGHGCPYCAGQKALSGLNDLETINPALIEEWNFQKNGKLKPSNFTANSGIKVWWICSKGHEWEARISDRNKGKKCPYCTNRKILKGFNDLQTVNPILASEWNFIKNDGLTPSDIIPGSEKIVWWKCSRGHEWEARINSRNKGAGCPECAKEKRKKNKIDS